MNTIKRISTIATFATIMASGQLNAVVVTITSGSTSGYTMRNGNTYVVENSVSFSNATAGGSGMTVADNATVVLYVPAGVTLTAKGGNGSGQTGGGAGICVPATATLIITGEGTVNATGGNAGDGKKGADGSYGRLHSSWAGTKGWSGDGGAGGLGGGGAGAGIGGSGGPGGSSGSGAQYIFQSATTYTGSSYSDAPGINGDGQPGGDGGRGSNGKTMGVVYAIGKIQIAANGGRNGSAGSAGPYAEVVGEWDDNTYYTWGVPNKNYAIIASGGGGGGGGGAGTSPSFGIGGGGASGGGGGGGGSGALLGSSDSIDWYTIRYANAHGGSGSGGGSQSKPGATGDAAVSIYYSIIGGLAVAQQYVTHYGGDGGAGGAAGAEGGAGTLYVSPTATVNVERAKLSATTHKAAQYTITFNANLGESASTVETLTATLGSAMPECIEKPNRPGWSFFGWVDDNGTQYYGNDGTKMFTSFSFPHDVTLHAVWDDKYVIPDNPLWLRDNVNVGWFVEPDSREEPILRSGLIGSNTNSWMETSIVGPASFSFDWKVSCNTRGHYLAWFIDGVEQARIRGDSDWATVSASIPEGEHSVRFDYVKGSTAAAGEDKGQVRNFSIDPVRIQTDSMQVMLDWTTNYLVSVTTTGFGAADFGSGWIADGSNVVVTLSPAIHSYSITMSGDTDGAVLDGTNLTFQVNGAARSIAVSIDELKLHFAVVSDQGTPMPAVGDHLCDWNAEVTASVEAPAPSDNTRILCTGWTGTGSVPASGKGSSVTFTILEDSSITWNWTTEYLVSVTTTGFGAADFKSGWIVDGSNVVVTLSPTIHSYSITMSGDTDGAVLDGTNLTFQVNGAARSIAVSINEVKPHLAVVSSQGISTPAVGYHLYDSDEVVAASVEAPAPSDDTRIVCTGWTGTGSVPASGNGSSVTFAIFEDSSITWNWTTEYLVEFAIVGKGTTTFGNQWVAAGTNLEIPFTINTPYYALSLAGDMDGAVIGNGVITVPVTTPRSLTLTVTEHTYESALDNGQLMWTSDGATTWIPQLEVSHDGQDSARSGEVTGDDVSALSTTVIGPGTLSWWWKLEMAGCAGVDVFVDGTLLSSLDSPTDWAAESIQITGDGAHAVRFEFWNAGTAATISDCAYLDHVSWSGTSVGLAVYGVTASYDGMVKSVAAFAMFPDGATPVLRYALAKGGPYSETNPAFTDTGTNMVWVIASAEGQEPLTNCAQVVILPRPLETAMFEPVQDQMFDGAAKTPTIVPCDGWFGILSSDDYVARYEDNVNVGTARIVVEGRGNFSGRITIPFVIAESADTFWYVDSEHGDDGNTGRSWGNALRTIQSAVDRAVTGNTVFVTNGVYGPVSALCLGITIRSVSGAASTTIDGGGTNRCATLGTSTNDVVKTTLVGFTLCNGNSDNLKEHGGGALGGILRDCIVAANSCPSKGAKGGGLCHSFAYHCVITNNVASDDGGGAMYSELFDSLIANNRADNSGGSESGAGIANSHATRCTITGNQSVYGSSSRPGGGGADKSILTSCIVYGNTYTTGAASDANLCSATYSCFGAAVSGTGNMVANPMFNDAASGDYRLQPGSPCIDAGYGGEELIGNTDLDGHHRWIGVSADMGCYEWGTHYAATTQYVSQVAGNDANDGLSWATAKKTIQNALDCAIDGDEIIVAAGVYKENSYQTGGLSNDRGANVLIRSADGPLVTYIDGSGVRRVVKGTASSTQNSWTEHSILLEGFTIQNGKHSGPGGVAYVKLRNCILSNNIALNMTAVSYAAQMENCLIVGNVASNASHKTDGILFAKTDLVSCTVVGNKGFFADGANVMNGGSFANCVVYGNEFGSTLLSPSGATASHTSFEYPLQGEGNIGLSTSPFADAANGDYRLRADSPCIDAGASEHTTCASDLAGNPRVRGRSIDMGCYEFQTVRTETMTTPIPVPYVWLEKYPSIVTSSAQEADHEAAAKETSANGVNKVWECYVAGLSPTNAQEVFRAVISFEDGRPVVSWEPDLNEGETKHERVYRVLGAKTLGCGWDDVTDIADPGAEGYRFFKATVTMP